MIRFLPNSTDCTVKDFIDMIFFDFPFERLVRGVDSVGGLLEQPAD